MQCRCCLMLPSDLTNEPPQNLQHDSNPLQYGLQRSVILHNLRQPPPPSQQSQTARNNMRTLSDRQHKYVRARKKEKKRKPDPSDAKAHYPIPHSQLTRPQQTYGPNPQQRRPAAQTTHPLFSANATISPPSRSRRPSPTRSRSPTKSVRSAIIRSCNSVKCNCAALMRERRFSTPVRSVGIGLIRTIEGERMGWWGLCLSEDGPLEASYYHHRPKDAFAYLSTEKEKVLSTKR